MVITTILPISRIQYLDKVLECLKNQTYKPNNLIVVYDGPDNSYLHVRNKIVELEYDNVLCVPSNDNRVAFAITERRNHIVNIHNQIRELMGDCDWVFAIEDDGVFPNDALEKLIKNVVSNEDVGIVTGVELGRWGIPYVGAWTVDSVTETRELTSLENKTADGNIEAIDGCGLYCALIRAEYYKSHQFYTRNGIGPDVNLGLYLRQQGFKNYIDWSIHVTHLTSSGSGDVEIPATSRSPQVTLSLLSGSTWASSYR